MGGRRHPVVLAPEAWPAWLGEEPADEAHLKSLLAPYSSDGMMCWLVSPRVGGVKNNDPSLMEPIDCRVRAAMRIAAAGGRLCRHQDRERSNQCPKRKSHKRCSCST